MEKCLCNVKHLHHLRKLSNTSPSPITVALASVRPEIRPIQVANSKNKDVITQDGKEVTTRRDESFPPRSQQLSGLDKTAKETVPYPAEINPQGNPKVKVLAESKSKGDTDTTTKIRRPTVKAEKASPVLRRISVAKEVGGKKRRIKLLRINKPTGKASRIVD